MRQYVRLVSMITSFALLILLAVPLNVQAQSEDGGLLSGGAEAQGELIGQKLDPSLISRLRERPSRIKVMVELQQPSIVERVDLAIQSGADELSALQAGQGQLAAIEQGQNNLLTSVRSLDTSAQVLYETQRVLNGVALSVAADQVAAIATLPNVKAVYALNPVSLDNASSVPLIGAPEVWRAAAGATGDGISIGIIDTGIDYLHVNFGGPGTDAAYTANNTTVISDDFANYFGPTAVKVKGGYDFAGDAYDADFADSVPKPDPDPMDCNGHGSHVAGSAAGFGTTTARTTFPGPYNTVLNFDDFYIGPGAAPEADLYALRVFGCGGSSDVVPEALDWAVDPNGDGNLSDHLDIVNMSLGSDYGNQYDATTLATNRAAQAGVIIVTSAGNSGDTHYITGSPGSSNYALAVASSVDARDVFDAFEVDTPPSIAGIKTASFAVAYDWANSPPVSGDLVYIAGQNTGCSAFSGGAPAQIAGKILLLDWTDGQCGSVARTANAYAAGAIGVIIADTEGFYDLLITGSEVIPSVSTSYEIGVELKTALGLGAVTITFDGDYLASTSIDTESQVDTISDFSSRGPRLGDSFLKPDIAAPGNTIFSAATSTGTDGTTISGTSMAAPHMAGVMALLRELRPTLSVAEIKALAMNTASYSISGSGSGAAPFQAVQRSGTGRVNVPRAAVTRTIAYNTDQPELVSLSFGNLEIGSSTTITKTITVKNFGPTPSAYRVSYAPATTISGVSYTVTPSAITVPANGTTRVSVVLNADPALMRHSPDPLLALDQGGLPRNYMAEAAGTVEFFAAAPTAYTAFLSGSSEVPPNSSAATANASFTYNAATNTLGYVIRFSAPITIAGAGSHLHRGPDGKNWPVAVNLLANGAYAANTNYSGNVVLSDADEGLLFSGGLYANIHTAAFPNGQIRGQLIADVQPSLRVATHALARPTSNMRATADKLGFFNAATGTTTLRLSGTGLNTGTATPVDIQSLVSAFELQYESNATITGPKAIADLAAVGVTSDLVTAGSVADSYLYFGVATHAAWNTPNQVSFEVYIDTDGSGVDADGEGAEYLLYTTNYGIETTPDSSDAFITVLVDLETQDAIIADFINILGGDELDARAFNSNVLVFSVASADLGLSTNNTAISYRVFSFDQDSFTYVDETSELKYDLAKPGISFGDNAGLLISPAYLDVNNGTIPITYNRANYNANKSKGVLLLHHHNASGNRYQTLLFNPSLHLPLINKAR